MNIKTIAVVAALTATALCAAGTASAAPALSTPASVAKQSTAQYGTWTPAGQATAPLTRAQVYKQLVHAERDGEMNYLNNDLFAHS